METSLPNEDPAAAFVEPGNRKNKLIIIVGSLVSIVLGVTLGYYTATKTQAATSATSGTTSVAQKLGLGGKSSNDVLKPEDFRDTATGVVKVKPDKDKNIPGSHILQRNDSQWPVYLISSRVDLSSYEDKNVKVSGITYGCEKGKWCLEVNKVE